MGKGPPSPQNGEVPVVPTRQRPEEILAQTLGAAPRPEVTDGWSLQGRRIFLIVMAAAGIVLVIAGLLVTKELAPGPGSPAPLETGPGNGLAGQLLQSSAGDETPSTVPGSTPLALPLTATPSTPPTRSSGQSPTPVAPGVLPAPANDPRAANTTAPTNPPPSPTTTLPCPGLLGQGVQQVVPLPCRAPASSALAGGS